jgi:hypothetical protein
MCSLAKVNRVGFYRYPTDPLGTDLDIELRNTVQRTALESPGCD